MSPKRKNDDRQISTALISELFLSMKTIIHPDGAADEDFKKHLFAMIHARRANSKEAKKGGRPSKYNRDELKNQSLMLERWLDEETDGWLKLPYFVTNCVPALWFPLDLKHALDGGKINLEEARILSLVTRKNLGRKVDREPYHIRRDLLDSHLRRNGTQKELRRRVNAKLGKTSKAEAESVTRVVATLDAEVSKLIEFDELDTDHLLWEEIKNLVFMARDVDVTLIEGEELTELLDDLGKIQFKLYKYKPRIKDLIEQE
jgi:hypothetical protein